MAFRRYRGNLSAAEYPLNLSLFGASVIIPAADQTSSRYLDTAETRDASIGIPQIYYAENVLPTKEGISSLISKQNSGGTDGAAGADEEYIFDEFGNKLMVRVVLVSRGGTKYDKYIYVYDISSWWGAWRIKADITLATAADVDAEKSKHISSAYIQGKSYVFAEGEGLYVYDADTGAFAKAVMGGLEESTLRGIVGASGYIIAYSKTAVAWSTTLQLFPDDVQRSYDYVLGDVVRKASTPSAVVQYKCTTAGTTNSSAVVYSETVGDVVTDGTAQFTCEDLTIDFEPSLVTGAGGGEVDELDGHIITAYPGLTGFILYSTNNMVAAVYTNNAQYPFTFRAIANSAGITKPSDVTDSAAVGTHYALTKNGLMQVATTGAKLIEPAVTDWLNSTQRLRIDYSSGLPIVQSLLYKFSRLAFVKNRYLCISRGTSYKNYEECLIWDTALQRYGQITIPHALVTSISFVGAETDSSGYAAPLTFVTESNAVTFVKAAGGINPEGYSNISGTIVLGRYRYVREQLMTLLGVTLGQCDMLGSSWPTIHAWYTTNRAMDQRISPPLTINPEFAAASGGNMYPQGYRRNWFARLTADEISLVVRGAFMLNTVELEFNSGGHR